jgi:hypothetical protein
MKQELTKQDILELFAKSDERFEKRLAMEADERKKTKKEADERFEKSKKEADERFEKRLAMETAERLKSKKEFDERFEKRLAKEAAERLKSKKEFDKKIGELTGTLGRFVEGLIEPNILNMFREKGIFVKQTYNNVKIYNEKNEKETEIDLLLINSDYSIAVEVKTTLNIEAVNEHLSRLDRIQTNPPKGTKGTILLGAVCGIRIDEQADRYAYRKGLYVLKQKGEIVKIANDDKFKPKEWKVAE